MFTDTDLAVRSVMRPWKDDPRDLDERDFELMGLPKCHWATTIDKIVDEGDPSPRRVTERYLDKILEMRRNGHGLFLWGPNESGKSAIAAHILKQYRRYNQAGLFTRSEKLRRASFGDVTVAGRDLWKRAEAVDVLVIDDLGKEHEGGSGYARSQIDLLLRERYADNRVTIFTTNIDIENPVDRKEKLKKSTLNLIVSSATAVHVKGATHRTDEAKEMHRTLLGN